jgi:hypothetical protein
MEIRKRYVSPKTIANSYDMSVKTIYKYLQRPEFQTAVIKTGEKTFRVDEQKYFDIMKQIFR